MSYRNAILHLIIFDWCSNFWINALQNYLQRRPTPLQQLGIRVCCAFGAYAFIEQIKLTHVC